LLLVAVIKLYVFKTYVSGWSFVLCRPSDCGDHETHFIKIGL
jgi:hypothetical protein